MKLKRSKSGFSFSWILIVALLILLYSSYFLMYIPKQEMRVKERGFRILEEYADNIHKKKDYYQTHIKNYGPYYLLRDHVNRLGKALENNGAGLDTAGIKGVIASLEKAMVLDSLEAINSVRYFGKGKKYLAFPLVKTSGMEICDEVSRCKNTVLLPIDKLMEGLKFDKLFWNIAFLDSSGVINNSDGSLVHDITNFRKMLNDTVSKTQGGVFQKLEIQGMKSHVLILPIRFLDRDFYVAGFIPDKEFRKKTRTINNQLLTILSGIMLLLLVCMPILKIVFINQKERLNVRDAHNTTVSVILGTSLLVLLFIGTMKYYLVDRSSTSQRIREVSEVLAGNVESDLQRLYNLAGKVLTDKNVSTDSMCQYLDDSVDFYTVDDSIYPDSLPFNEIIFMDENGKAVKAVTSTAFSNLVQLDLSDRNYFRIIEKDSKLAWPWKESGSDSIDAFYIESIKSYNTGFKETAISFRLKKPAKTGKGEAPYMAITSHIPSVYDQVLPKDMAFMVVNSSGDVLFHSNQAKILHENFLVECDHEPRIEGGIRYRTKELARITYNEKLWLAQIVPLEKVPLFHITLIDLQMKDNTNTRIYLFTFYFLLVVFGLIVAGMQIFRSFGTQRRFLKSKNWTFDWLIFDEGKQEVYNLLLVVQLFLILLQGLGPFWIVKPVGVLLYQLTFVAFSAVVAYIFLHPEIKHQLRTLTAILSSLPLVCLTVLSLRGAILSGILLLTFVPQYFVFCGTSERMAKMRRELRRIADPLAARKAYLWYMFFWLVGLSVFPVIASYYSIKTQENRLAQKAEMMFMAQSNLLLHNTHGDKEDDRWLENSNGSGIDDLTIDVFEYGTVEPDNASETKKLFSKAAYLDGSNLDLLYRQLQSPITKDDFLMTLLQERNRNADWKASGALEYTQPGLAGKVEVKVSEVNATEVKSAFVLVALIFVPVILLIIFIWQTYLYIAELVLGSIVGKWSLPRNPSWKKIVADPEFRLILLNTFDGKPYREKINPAPQIIKAEELFDPKNSINSAPKLPAKVLWVSGVGRRLLDYKQSAEVLPKLKQLIGIEGYTIVFELPFDTDFIRERLQEHIVEYVVGNEEEAQIQSYLASIVDLFSGFYRYTGSVDKEALEAELDKLREAGAGDERSDAGILADQHILKLRYNYIWNNLSRMEKLILFDLADDGMLNFKNRFLINRLHLKGLIEVEPYPHIFTPGFQYFLKYSVDADETRQLEHSMGKEGKWKNARYLILLLLIPLVAFVFISQGSSIEKVVGILTGVLALFSGAVRLMDSTWFSNVPKQN